VKATGNRQRYRANWTQIRGEYRGGANDLGVAPSTGRMAELWCETSAIAVIIAYDGHPMVKLGREFLLKKRDTL
jgi:hypothetical protein